MTTVFVKSVAVNMHITHCLQCTLFGYVSIESNEHFTSNNGIPGLSQLAKLVSIDVGEIGVGGAKNFFESKIHLANKSNKFEEEVSIISYFLYGMPTPPP